MIRTKDIHEKQDEIKKLKSRSSDIEKQINGYYKDQDDAECGFEYAILDAHISGSEKRLEIIQKQIEQAEYELKVMKGEIEPVRVRSMERKETGLECFGVF